MSVHQANCTVVELPLPSITVYDADTLEILFQNVNAHASRVNDVAFSLPPDSSQIASGGDDGALKLWGLGAQ